MVSTRRSGRSVGADGAEPSTSGLPAAAEVQEPAPTPKRRSGSRVTASPAPATRTRAGRGKHVEEELLPVPEEAHEAVSGDEQEQPGPSQATASAARTRRGAQRKAAGSTPASETPQLASVTQPEVVTTTASIAAPQQEHATSIAEMPAATPAKRHKAAAATPTTAAVAAATAAGAAAAVAASPLPLGHKAATTEAAHQAPPAAGSIKQAASKQAATPTKPAAASTKQATMPAKQAAPVQPAPEAAAAAAHDEWDFSTDDDEDEENAPAGSAMMSQLAASIRAALQAKSGKPATASRKAAAAPAAGQSSAGQEVQVGPSSAAAAGVPAEATTLRWQPQVEVPLPTKEPTREVLKMTVEADKEKGLAKQLLAPPRDPRVLAKAGKDAKPDTAGKKWFDLPSQKIDADMKRELRLLRLRGAYDTKRFYKSFDNTKFPKYFAMGTVVEGPTEFYSGRLEAKQRRKASLTDQLLADGDLHQTRKKRYSKLQDEAMKYQRVKKRKTENARDVKRKPSPKH